MDNTITITRTDTGLVIDVKMKMGIPDEAGDLMVKLLHCLATGASKVVPNLEVGAAAAAILTAMVDRIESGPPEHAILRDGSH